MINPLEYIRQRPQLAKQLIGLSLLQERKPNSTSDQLRCQSSWAPEMSKGRKK